MIDRYADDEIREIFADHTRYTGWRQIELHYAVARYRTGDKFVPMPILAKMEQFPLPRLTDIRLAERRLGHDVVGFLEAWTRAMPPEVSAQVHAGLTSSDLVDNHHFVSLTKSSFAIRRRLDSLGNLLSKLSAMHAGTARAGRTHGQVGEPTTWGWRLFVWQNSAIALSNEWDNLRRQLAVLKTPGAVGSMAFLGNDVANAVAHVRGVVLVPSTQVIPRWRQMAWAAWLLQAVSLCEEIALEVRLSSRTEVGELMEGGTNKRVGSSAMPHKRNPIVAEQLSGLGRVARSHFAAIAETAGALHNERDISNSSVERLVVPDLAELTAYMVSKTIELISNLQIDPERMRVQAYAPLSGNQVAFSSAMQFVMQTKHGVPVVEANMILKQAYDTPIGSQRHIEQNVLAYDQDFSYSQFMKEVRALAANGGQALKDFKPF